MELISRKEAKEQGLVRYFTGKPCKNNHIDERQTSNGGCITCVNNSNNERRKDPVVREEINRKAREYTINNPDKVKERNRKSKLKNGHKHKKRRKERDNENADKLKEYSRNYYIENKDKIRESRREYYRLYMRKKRQDPEFKMKCRMRYMLRRVLEKTNGEKLSMSETMIGYTSLELKQHIESRFLEGMSWDNYGDWHIDHILPMKWFIDEGLTDPKLINALSNLQPLWAEDNVRKGASV